MKRIGYNSNRPGDDLPCKTFPFQRAYNLGFSRQLNLLSILCLSTLVYQALHGLLPSYLSDDCQLITDTGRSQLRSSTKNTCFVPRSHNGFGDRSFSVAGPALWNSLPASLKSPEHGFYTFKRLLKTYLF